MGYHLIDFDSNERHELLQPISLILTQPSFFRLLYRIIKKCIEADYLHTLVIQQAIYLLTLSVKLLSSKLISKFHKRLYSTLDGFDFSYLGGTYHLNEIRNAEIPSEAILRNFLHVNEDTKYV